MNNPIRRNIRVDFRNTGKKQSNSLFEGFLYGIRLQVWIALCFILWSACNLNEGKRTYERTCGNCHMDGGQGFVKLIPGFKLESFQSDRTKMICRIVQGINDTITDDFMPSYEFMNDAQIANILNYIARLKEFKIRPFTDKDVITARKQCN